MTFKYLVLGLFLSSFALNGCGGGGGGGDVSNNGNDTTSSSYIVLAWNDLGMHCLNPSYDTAVILPAYNTILAQVIKRDNPPQVVTSGLTVSYRILNNTTSQKGLFTQFWTYSLQLFGVAPATDMGLNLEAGGPSNGLSGTMLAKGDHFQVNGIPVVPYEDGSSVRNPYQVAEVTVKDASGNVVAQTRATVPTSDEINCGKCHAVGGTVTEVFNDILIKHDTMHGTTLQSQKPVLCATCHGSPVLGTSGAGSSGIYLSKAIHGSHSTRGAGCYDCHPGATTKCNRSTKHTNNNAADGNCTATACHGDMANVASSISNGRIPWVSEPKCVSCHSGVPQVDTATVLYRNAVGHGGVYCAGCHGSPHAMVPSNQDSDNYQALQYQKKAMVLGDCRNCHGTSRGGGNDFAEEHTNRNSACNICHTGFQNAGNTAKYPHQFQWKSRR
jgi:hypothetical protein